MPGKLTRQTGTKHRLTVRTKSPRSEVSTDALQSSLGSVDKRLLQVRLFERAKPDDPLLRMIGQVSERKWPRGLNGRQRKKGSSVAESIGGNGSAKQEGRWPLDLVKECSGNGVLALRVWRRAGLRPYGLSDGDMVFIGVDDPDEGGPAFAAINNKVVIGRYNSGPRGRVTIRPFVEGTPPVTAQAREIQVVFRLKAIAYQSRVWSLESRV